MLNLSKTTATNFINKFMNGWLAQAFDTISFGTVGWFNIYGLHGVVLAHVFFNLPLMINSNQVLSKSGSIATFNGYLVDN